MSTANLGRCGFEDAFIPVKGKSEWGMDTLRRRMEGARSLMEAYIATLEQGQIYQGYYLQSWDPDDNPDKGAITLVYKGLLTGGTPIPDIQSGISPATGSISISYSAENNGLGRIYRRSPMFELDFGNGVGAIGGQDTFVAFRDVYTTGATMEFTYDAPQTTYRYIVLGKPDRPKFYDIDIPRVPVVKRARITTADGAVYGKNGPAAITSDLTPELLKKVIDFQSKNVIGTPYYECQDVVRRELGEGDSDDSGSFGGP